MDNGNVFTNAKATSRYGVDWVVVDIQPEPDVVDAQYTIRVDASFLMSNWTCLFGNGCPGLFTPNESVIRDDVGCCKDSFYVQDDEDQDKIVQMISQLTDDDWDIELSEEVEKNGWLMIGEDGEPKGRVFEGSCVFNNRNGGSADQPGCAFVAMSRRTGGDHIDVMPNVCWMLPLKYEQVDDSDFLFELGPWTIDKWFVERDHINSIQNPGFCSWWCVDSPEPYVGAEPVYKAMERELRQVVGDHAYETIREALEARVAQGWKPMPMPGSVLNEGRPLLPLIVGNRTPLREPSYYPDYLAKLKEADHGQA